VPVSVGLWLVVWYALGYAFYSMAYGAVGALASRMEDAQTASGPLTFSVVAVYFFVFWFVVEELDGVVSTIASFVPLTAPLVMPLRLAFGSASAWEGVLAALVMVASIYGLVRLAGRVYTGAILRTGRRVSMREAWGGSR
jgi:ABC-2 type transport system permease protein